MTVSREEILQQARFLSIFDTPAYVSRLPGMEAVNAQLVETILAKERSTPGGLDNSNMGGWHSGRDLVRWGGAVLRPILQAAVTMAGQLTIDRQGRPLSPGWKIECWANVNRKGHANRRHSHPGCFWSGSYYLTTGEAGSGSGQGGEFEFHDPRGIAPAVLPPQGTHRQHAPERDPLIVPEAGMMVLFPAWMPHSVRPFSGEGPRISIAFNLALAEGRGQ